MWKWLAAALLALAVYLDNQRVVVRKFILTFDNLPKEYDNLRILHLSDFHNAVFGKDNKRLLEKVKKAKGDIIFFTGDLVYRRKPLPNQAIDFLKELVKIAPVYYVTGNHETAIHMDEMQRSLEKIGVCVLRNRKTIYRKEGAKDCLSIFGLEDPRFYGENYEKLESHLVDLEPKKEEFSLLLSHRPECFERYQNKGIDLVFSGHMHGGQFRLPLLGGILSPQRTFFPKYQKGIYEEQGTVLVLSAGLGNSVIPVRIGNPSEFGVVIVKRKEQL